MGIFWPDVANRPWMSHGLSTLLAMSKGLKQQIEAKRLAEMILAVELEVDRDEFVFRSQAELELWCDLEAEFDLRWLREGRSWVAAA